MSRIRNSRPRRWFLISLVGLFIFLCGAIILAAVLLLRRGKLPRTGLIAGSSMEPIFRGPRFKWSCPNCSALHAFALDTCKSSQPFACSACKKIDQATDVDFEDVISIADRINPGVQVRFATLRAMRASRSIEIAKGTAKPSGLRRGDVVVFEESLGAKREIKRIVGFPWERIAIDQGDLFVEDVRWAKSLEQTLRQSILIHAWDRARQMPMHPDSAHSRDAWICEGSPFSGELNTILPHSDSARAVELTFNVESPHFIDNRLAINAHDSHAIIPVRDFGFAFQVTDVSTEWSIRCKFASDSNQPHVDLLWNSTVLTIQYETHVATIEMNQQKERAAWIVLAMIDGYIVIGSQDEEWLRVTLPLGDPAIQQPKTTRSSPIEIAALSGTLSVDQLLVFRDIHYRGNGDSSHQTWDSANQIIVLGDNVSSSSDSRDRWPDGLSPNSVKGVVLQMDNPMETLLRQR